jgi:LAO/AO transport system kinase
LERSGGLLRRRAEQQRDWMWSLIDDELIEAVRQCPAVRSRRAGLEQAVMAGDLSAVDAAQQVLSQFAANLPAAWR